MHPSSFHSIKLIFIVFVFVGLNSNAQMTPGEWRGALKLNDTIELPFVFTAENNKIIIRNGEEKIVADEITYRDDSVFISMPVFDSEFRCSFTNQNMTGFFYNHARKNKNVIPFYAEHGMSYRFTDKPENTSINISGRFHVIFEDDDPESKNAVGVFKQNGNHLTGTFLTTTGDYRYLEGEVNGNRLWLSAFDGSHLFLFTALVIKDSLINGEFFSGQHYHGPWKGRKDENAVLPPADSLTALKPGYDKLEFSFPDENGKIVSLTDPQFENKVVIVQLMGSWCPNCMDETKFLSEWYNKENKGRIEIVALDFERITDSATVNKNIRRLKNRYDIRYPVLFAGSSDKKLAAQALPMLNRVFAYPTTIFLTSKKKVFKIHTGFSGPATGEEYEKYVEWFKKMVAQIK